MGLVELARPAPGNSSNAYGTVVVVLIIGPSARTCRVIPQWPPHGSKMIAETQRRRSLALGKVAVELQLTAQGYPCPRPFGLASLGVADCLRRREEVHSAGGWNKRTPSSSPRTRSSRPTVQSPTVAHWLCRDAGPRSRVLPAQQPAPRAPRDRRRRLRRVVRRCRPPTRRQVQLLGAPLGDIDTADIRQMAVVSVANRR
jgi:hypothetical protein